LTRLRHFLLHALLSLVRHRLDHWPISPFAPEDRLTFSPSTNKQRGSILVQRIPPLLRFVLPPWFFFFPPIRGFCYHSCLRKSFNLSSSVVVFSSLQYEFMPATSDRVFSLQDSPSCTPRSQVLFSLPPLATALCMFVSYSRCSSEFLSGFCHLPPEAFPIRLLCPKYAFPLRPSFSYHPFHLSTPFCRNSP